MKYDVVIIGSGLGGLTCGCILAKNGMNVAVLEKNNVIGGCLQSFVRDGVAFDTGMHYIGGLQEGGAINRLWNYLDVLDNIKLRKLDEHAYDVFRIDEKKYAYTMGYERFTDTLSEYFPNEKENIKKYVERMRTSSESSDFFNLRDGALPGTMNETMEICADEYISSVTNNAALRKVIAGNVPLYAGEKGKTPLYVHFAINNSNIQGCYRIIGGGSTLAYALRDSIIKYGGTVLPNHEAKEIVCREKAYYVKTINGEVFEANDFISDVHPCILFNMIDSPLIRSAYRNRINDLENSVSNFTVYLRFKENTVEYMNSNFCSYLKDDVWEGEKFSGKEWPSCYSYMHQAVDENNKYARGAILMSYMQFGEVREWNDTKTGRRGSEYETFKRERAEKLIGLLEKDFPGTAKNISSYYTSTPLTYRDYTYTMEGSSYGIVKDANNLAGTIIPHKTKIPNLFLTGQNTNFHGALGVSLSAVITCSELLGMNKIIKEINKTNLI